MSLNVCECNMVLDVLMERKEPPFPWLAWSSFINLSSTQLGKANSMSRVVLF